jgi:hypothetical protein
LCCRKKKKKKKKKKGKKVAFLFTAQTQNKTSDYNLNFISHNTLVRFHPDALAICRQPQHPSTPELSRTCKQQQRKQTNSIQISNRIIPLADIYIISVLTMPTRMTMCKCHKRRQSAPTATESESTSSTQASVEQSMVRYCKKERKHRQ